TRRQVTVRQLEPGLARVTADVPTVQGVGIVNRLRDIATELHQQNQTDTDTTEGDADAGAEGTGTNAVGPDSGRGATDADTAPVDERTHSQLMADVFCDLLLTGTPDGHGTTEHNRAALAAIRPTVHVTIPAGTLTAPARTATTLTGGTFTGRTFTGRETCTGVAEIPGYGPVDDDTARILAGAADNWVRVFTHPATGVPVNVDRYRPTTRQRLYLQARDLHCRFPGCRRPAAECDIDHTIAAAADGGPTDLCNLACLCPRHHTLKHQTDWQVKQLPGGILKWTSPTRRTHTTRPPGTIQFLPDHPPGKERHPAPF
ncbi:MAG TPA: HNH endonuclease signature motif containing protein, partial [Microbacterium sp.]|nr:HNH endonuclease signature motif containing protein [Microbacterium sp.]